MQALRPWLLEGAPSHYRDAGLSLYRDEASGHYWLEQGNSPSNPYGGETAELINWPDPMAAMSMNSESDNSADAQKPQGRDR